MTNIFDKFVSKEKPICEHCGEIEIGSLTINDGGVSWCINCYDAGDPISDKEYEQLWKKQYKSCIAAHEKRIKELKEKLK